MGFTDQISGNDLSSWDTFKNEIQVELEQAEQEIQEIRLMLEQSYTEVGRLAQKNSTVTTRLQQLHGHSRVSVFY